MKMNLSYPYTYFRRYGFSINEGEFPNIHISWRERFHFYLAISRKLKLHFSLPLRRRKANA